MNYACCFAFFDINPEKIAFSTKIVRITFERFFSMW